MARTMAANRAVGSAGPGTGEGAGDGAFGFGTVYNSCSQPQHSTTAQQSMSGDVKTEREGEGLG